MTESSAREQLEELERDRLSVYVAHGTTLFVDVPWSYTQLGIVSALVMWLGGWRAFRVYNARAERLAAERGIRR